MVHLDKKVRRIFPPQQCTYSTIDCSTEDECGCNQFSTPFNVPIKVLGLVGEIMQQSKNLAAMQRSDMRNWVMKRGHVISLTQPSAFMAF